MIRLAALFSMLAGALLLAQTPAPAPAPLPALVPVRSIEPPRKPFDQDDARQTRYAFFAYGDTRSGANPPDGLAPNPRHGAIVDAILDRIEPLRKAKFPARFVVQTGDAVLRGQEPMMWNASFTPVVERLTRANLSYFFAAGNHDTIGALGTPARSLGFHNMVGALARLVPPEGSPRRLNGYLAYTFTIGRTFFLTFDSNLAADPLQFAWVKAQFESLDRTRYPQIVVFDHHPPYSSGAHGGPALIEPQSLAMREQYMPLFRAHHVQLFLSGHEHFFEHYVERYEDGSGRHRMDVIVTGGGGAPTYAYRGEPDIAAYLAAGAAQKVTVEHLAMPGRTAPENPNHFLILRVDGDTIELEVVGVTGPLAPYGGKASVTLRD